MTTTSGFVGSGPPGSSATACSRPVLGLLRRARLLAPHHIFDLDRDEVRALLVVGTGPTDVEVADRHARRATVIAAQPPTSLGPDAEGPPVDVFPPPLRRATRAVLAMIAAMNGETPGTTICVAWGSGPPRTPGARSSPAMPKMFSIVSKTGDIVVTACTGPTWNSLLPIIGALVVEEGGPVCHAAIVAREFGIPAVVGATGATSAIPDGAQVTVDPSTGTITLG